MKIFENKNIKQLACGDEHALALTGFKKKKKKLNKKI